MNEQLKQENQALRKENRELLSQIGDLLESGTKMLEQSRNMLATQTKLYESLSLIAACSTMRDVHKQLLQTMSEIEQMTRMNLPTTGVN
jgi:hypothetical protein